MAVMRARGTFADDEFLTGSDASAQFEARGGGEVIWPQERQGTAGGGLAD